jgi:hypothetical protein
MDRVHVFVTTGRFGSFAAMRAFIDAEYSEDGDEIPSQFMNEIDLEEYEPACIEAIHSPDAQPLQKLLQGVSYGDQWLHLLPASVVANEAICVYAPNVVGRPEGSSLQYCGTYRYRVSPERIG